MNFCFQAKELGAEAILCSAIGEDELGQELQAFFGANGLSTEGLQVSSQYPTGQSIIDVSRPDDPRFQILEDVAWDYLKLTKTLQKLMSRASAIYFDTLGQRHSVSRQVIHQVLDEAPPRCLRVFDVNFKQHYYTRESVEFSLMKSNIVKMSLEEAFTMADLLNFGGSRTQENIARWVSSAYHVQQVCITRGSDGCLLLERSPGGSHFTTIDSPGRQVKVRDTVGCGDGFAAALVFARLQEWEPRKQADFANCIGSLIATRQGGTSPLPEKTKKIISEMIESDC